MSNLSFSMIPSDVWALVLNKLPLGDIHSFAETERFANRAANTFLLTQIDPELDADLPIFKKVQKLFERKREECFDEMHSTYYVLYYDEIHSTLNGIRDLLNSIKIKEFHPRQLVEDLSAFSKNIKTLEQWNLISKLCIKEMPDCPLIFEVHHIKAIFDQNQNSPALFMKELARRAEECEELYKLHAEFFNARSILIVWDKLVLAIPEANRGELTVRPGLDRLTSVPEVISKAKEFPAWFQCVKPNLIERITSLQFWGLGLTLLPKEICELTRLQKLNLEDNRLASLPKGLGKLSELKELELSRNLLSDLPEDIGQLANLESLELNQNQLRSIPSSIGHLKKLINLKLKRNKLTSIPSEIGQLSNLRVLELRSNQLLEVPSVIGNLPLTSLDLCYNRLKQIPAEILGNSRLFVLAQNNQITTLPWTDPRFLLRLCLFNSEITFRNNPLSSTSQIALIAAPVFFVSSAITVLTIAARYFGFL